MNTSIQVKTACAAAGVTLSELAQRLGTTPQNLSLKLKRGTFRPDDLEHIANALGIKYISVFRFPDGKEI